MISSLGATLAEALRFAQESRRYRSGALRRKSLQSISIIFFLPPRRIYIYPDTCKEIVNVYKSEIFLYLNNKV